MHVQCKPRKEAACTHPLSVPDRARDGDTVGSTYRNSWPLSDTASSEHQVPTATQRSVLAV